ncbi:UNVERIFIED_CONTAM: hypothetical protein K2H54_062478 [Gekko kuhli]
MAAAAASPSPDVASASSAALFRLRHLRLGLELRPEARALAGCLVLELCALRADRRRALVLDAHPALRVASVAFRACPAGGAAEEEEEEEEACRRRCAFVFPDAGQGGASSWGPGELSGATALPAPGCPLADPHPHCPLSPRPPEPAPRCCQPGTPASCPPSASCCPPRTLEPPPLCPPLAAQAGCPHPQGCSPEEPAPSPGPVPPDAPASPRPATPFADLPPAPEMPPPPLPAFPDEAAAFPLVFRVDPFTDYGSSLTVFLPSSLQPHQPFQVVVRYTTTDAPAVSIPSAAGVDPKEGFGGRSRPEDRSQQRCLVGPTGGVSRGRLDASGKPARETGGAKPPFAPLSAVTVQRTLPRPMFSFRLHGTF